jgi:UDP-3-O-[3-hydroxymyristoyl] N-acetylglucosamine deacetylase
MEKKAAQTGRRTGRNLPVHQCTVGGPVRFSGVGLHTGRPVMLVVLPAPAGQGIVFHRTDVTTGCAMIPARWDRVIVSPLNTRIANDDGVSVSTIEHLMAALAGTGVHNATVEVDGPEVPIMDGSAAAFVRGLVSVGLRTLPAPLDVIEILREVRVTQGSASAALSPATTLQFDFTIDFPDGAIGRQQLSRNMANGTFVREFCNSRTFCRLSDVSAMRAQGLALGGTMDNAVVVDGDQVLSPSGLRHKDEAVRHKILDALGDLATAGAPILGRYTGDRAGHALTNQLLHALFTDPAAWRRVICTRAIGARLPGQGVSPADISHVA